MASIFDRGFSFIDLFAGIGGFHQAMTKLGGTCVYAAEKDKETAETYMKNYHIDALNDITKLDPNDIPQHDVLCAGFPCQSFSKAGKQEGFGDVRGVLFFDIIRILKNHIERYGGPRFLILENVRNLVSHDSSKTWKRIKQELKDIGYNVIENPLIVSPHYFGIPQLRERAVILAVKNDYYSDEIKIEIERKSKNTCDMNSVLVNKSDSEYILNSFRISDYERIR